MSRRAKTVAGVLLAASVLSCPTRESAAGLLDGKPSHQVPVGVRAIGMGGAFTTVADDASAIFWNPAGLASIRHQELMGSHARPYHDAVRDSYAAFLLPLSPNLAAALDWSNSGVDDDGLDWGENRFDLAVSANISPVVALGVNGKLITTGTTWGGVDYGSGTGFGLDAGVLVKPMPRLRVGAVVQDVFDTRIHFSGGVSEVAYPRNLRIGASYALARFARLAVDLDDRSHIGAEYFPVKQWGLRAGFQHSLRSEDDAVVTSLGTSVKAGIFQADYAFESHNQLGSTHHVGLTLAFLFNPSLITIEAVETQPLFTSLYKTYASTPFGEVVVYNKEEEPLEADLEVFVPGMMDSPTQKRVVLKPKTREVIPLTAVFTDQSLASEEDRPVQIEVSATYQSARLLRTEKRSAKAIVYGRGSINWGAGIEQAAAFVTPRDPVVDAFARAAGREVALREDRPFGNRNLAFAAGLFAALEEIGTAYVPDPHNPYASVSQSEFAVDTIHYPRETLQHRSGDCDDTTVLYCSLLSNVGVGTQLVDVPEHIFVLVDTGVHERNRLALGVDPSLLVVRDQRVWVPVETTALGSGFAVAWELGARSFHDWNARGRASTADVGAARARYEAGSLARPSVVPEWDLTGVHARVDDSAAAYEVWNKSYLSAVYGDTDNLPQVNISANNQLARVYFLASDLDKAKENLEAMIQEQPTSAAAWNNLGLATAASGDLDGGEAHIHRALDLDGEDPGIWFNLSLLRLLNGDESGGMTAIQRGLELNSDQQAIRRLLRLPPAPSEDSPPDLAHWLKGVLVEGQPSTAAGSGEETTRPVFNTRTGSYWKAVP